MYANLHKFHVSEAHVLHNVNTRYCISLQKELSKSEDKTLDYYKAVLTFFVTVTVVLASTKVAWTLECGGFTPTGHHRYLSSTTDAAMGSLWTV